MNLTACALSPCRQHWGKCGECWSSCRTRNRAAPESQLLPGECTAAAVPFCEVPPNNCPVPLHSKSPGRRCASLLWSVPSCSPYLASLSGELPNEPTPRSRARHYSLLLFPLPPARLCLESQEDADHMLTGVDLCRGLISQKQIISTDQPWFCKIDNILFKQLKQWKV